MIALAGRSRLTAALILATLCAPQAGYADSPAQITTTAAQPMTLGQIADLVAAQLGKPVKITLAPEHEFLRADTGRKLAITWTGPLPPFLNAVAARFGLQWREDPTVIQIYDDARLVPPPPPAPAPSPAPTRPATTMAAVLPAAVPAPIAAPDPMPTAPAIVAAPVRPAQTPVPSPALPAAGAVELPAPALKPAGASALQTAAEAWAAGDYQAAVQSWTVLAQDGNADALFNLGQAARLGRGMKADMVRAADLYERAAALGHQKAAAFLARINAASAQAEASTPPAPSLIPQPSGLWAVQLGMYENMPRAMKGFSRILKHEPLTGYPVRFDPNGAEYQVTVEQLTPLFATQTCQRLAKKGLPCRVLSTAP